MPDMIWVAWDSPTCILSLFLEVCEFFCHIARGSAVHKSSNRGLGKSSTRSAAAWTYSIHKGAMQGAGP